MKQLIAGAGLIAATLQAGPALAQQAADAVAPEFGASPQAGDTARKPATAEEHMVAAAHPEAAKAGLAMLEKGGSAIDALVATQLVLGLVEPQSSGLGGGAFLVYHDAATGKPVTLDGRETAPLAATGDLFIGDDGEPLGFFDAVIGGRSVGTPGTVALLAEAHRRYGKLTWADLFQPAIKLAEDGFEVTPRLNASIARSAESLFRYPETRNYFFSEEGVPMFPGTKLTNQAYADTLRAIAENGEKAFYSGQIAEDVVKVIQEAEGNPGRLVLEDLEAYEVKERAAVCFDYRDTEICGMGPPSSGAAKGVSAASITAGRTGLPTASTRAWAEAATPRGFSKPAAIQSALALKRRFTRPRTAFCSCMTRGMPRRTAPAMAGKDG